MPWIEGEKKPAIWEVWIMALDPLLGKKKMSSSACMNDFYYTYEIERERVVLHIKPDSEHVQPDFGTPTLEKKLVIFCVAVALTKGKQNSLLSSGFSLKKEAIKRQIHPPSRSKPCVSLQGVPHWKSITACQQLFYGCKKRHPVFLAPWHFFYASSQTWKQIISSLQASSYYILVCSSDRA